MFVIVGGEQIFEDDKPEAVQGFMMSSGDINGAEPCSGRVGRQGPVQRMLRRVCGLETYANSWGIALAETRLSVYRDGGYFFSAGLAEWLCNFDIGTADRSPRWIWCWEERRLLSLSHEDLSIRGNSHMLFRMPGGLVVEITAEDIKHGEMGDASACAVARAVSRAVGHRVLLDGIGISCADKTHGPCFGTYSVGETLREWAGRFDNGLQVSPIRVRISNDIRRVERC